MHEESGSGRSADVRDDLGGLRGERGLLGELAYVVGKVRGSAHCVLCDITHGRVRKKPAFRALEEGSEIPIRLVHLNERSPALEAATFGRTPCVAGERDGRFDILLDADDLEAFSGSVDRFRTALDSALQARMPATD